MPLSSFAYRRLILIANRTTRSGENLKQFKGKIGYLKVICTFLITKTEASQSFLSKFFFVSDANDSRAIFESKTNTFPTIKSQIEILLTVP